ncbi:MAG: hypothetical protein AAB874_07060 [Patescibacteria group bacterium]
MAGETSEQTFGQLVDIRQLLTPQGIKVAARRYISNPFSTEVSRNGEDFVGKQATLHDLEESIASNGIVVLEGGHSTGKTALLKIAVARLVEKGAATVSHYVSLESISMVEPIDFEREIVDGIVRRKRKINFARKKAVIALDEIESLGTHQRVDEFVAGISVLRNQGHQILIGIIGDIHAKGDIDGELNAHAKQQLISLVHDSVVVNPLFTDDETRQAVSGNPQMFTDKIINYLVKEAGGHPRLAKVLAAQLFQILEGIRKGFIQIPFHYVIDRLKDDMAEKHLSAFFPIVVDNVIAAGYNPLTWQYTGKPENRPDERVYRNMLPGESSTIFKEWLMAYLEKRSQSSS